MGVWLIANSVNTNSCCWGTIGNGNSEDIRCKDFPQYFRNCVWELLSYKSLSSQLEYLNKDFVGRYFDINNFKTQINSAAITDIGDAIYYCGEKSSIFMSGYIKLC